MKDEYDFSDAKRGAVVPLSASQTEVSLRLDNDVLDWLRERVSRMGGGNYQEMLNSILRTYIQTQADADQESQPQKRFRGTARPEVSDAEIVEIVARYLKDKHPGGVTLEALTQGVRHEQDWWYVPVRPSFEPPRQYEYYEALADVEGALEDEENLTVLFLPTAPDSRG